MLVGTLFHNTKLDLGKWFAAIRILMITGKRPSVRKLARELQISKNTALLVITRVNRATPSERSLLVEKKTNPASSKPGPKPETLKIEGDWREAVKKSLAKKRPAEGWPKEGEAKK